jgi:hypothetical protein
MKSMIGVVPGGSMAEKDRLAEAFMKVNMLLVQEGRLEALRPLRDAEPALRTRVIEEFRRVIECALAMWEDSDAFFLDFVGQWKADFEKATERER